MKQGDDDDDSQKRKRGKFEMDEWDEEWDSKLEEVCVYAEITQQPVNSSKLNCTSVGSSWEVKDDSKCLADALKTKEGEVAILRAQLENASVAKQNDALQFMQKSNEAIERHKVEISQMQKAIDSLKGELEFKELEVRDLGEKVKVLEIKSPKVRIVERPLAEPDRSKLSQVAIPASDTIQKLGPKFVPFSQRKSTRLGIHFSKLVMPEFFKPLEEKPIIYMYDTNPVFPDGLEHLRQDTFKWKGLPRLTPKLCEMYSDVMALTRNDAKTADHVRNIYELTKDILTMLKNVLNFLCKLQIDIKAEEYLVNDTTSRDPLTINDLLCNKLIKPEERGTEARRALAVCACVLKVYNETAGSFSSREMLQLLQDIVQMIGIMMRPLEFSGVLAAISMFLEALFKTKGVKIPEESLMIAKSIIETMIFCRSKLDVICAIIDALTAASNYSPLFHQLCRQSSPDSCALHMDPKLNQAIVFTEDACPLKLLQEQIKTLAHLSNNRKATLRVAQSMTDWYHFVLANIDRSSDTPLWMLRDNELCCDITETFCHVLGLMAKEALKDDDFFNALEKGVMALREACKRNQRVFKTWTLDMLPFILKTSGVLDIMTKIPREYADWLISCYDTQMDAMLCKGSNAGSSSDSCQVSST